ncbi:hypothetical protein [Pantoea sp. RIT-PI-b]|uniref:hypothetical protein n=1 Tax=Pantoea sp. RIT-PI-b TaxID=1681195 RepID=UPI000A9285B4|nr:hypothetical protein [Pantoea sp. RIT-PI-b]
MKSKSFTCFETGWSVFIDVNMWLKWIGILSGIATIAGVVIALYAASVAYNQLISSRKESKSATAYQIYHQYLSMCIAYPNFSNGMVKPLSVTEEYAKYCWFVSSMLFSFEQILSIDINDEKWNSTIKSQLSRHIDHLKISSTVRERHWDESLIDLINDLVSTSIP